MKKGLCVAVLACLALLLSPARVLAQGRFYTKKGEIRFFSKSPLENIEASNKTVTAVLDSKTGDVQFAVLMKGFEFEKALMQEHFNESYVESDKYPKAGFRGMILNNSEINYGREGVYTARVKGKMSIHGTEKDIEATGKIIVNNSIPVIDLNYMLLLSDYRITIPALVKDKVAAAIRIIVNCPLEEKLN